MDVSTRAIRGWHRSRHLAQSLTFTALRRARVHHQPESHHSDQGVQSAAPTEIQTRQTLGGQSSLATVGEATENGEAARLMRTRKAEEVMLYDAIDLPGASQHLGRFLDDVSQQTRRHAAWGNLTPAAFETPWLPQPSTVPGQLETPETGPPFGRHYT
jgi:putative transposase